MGAPIQKKRDLRRTNSDSLSRETEGPTSISGPLNVKGIPCQVALILACCLKQGQDQLEARVLQTNTAITRLLPAQIPLSAASRKPASAAQVAIANGCCSLMLNASSAECKMTPPLRA